MIPTIPVLYHGALTVGGSPAPAETRLYVRVSNTGQPDIWRAWVSVERGRHNFPVAAPASGYSGGTAQFWMEGRTRTVTAPYSGAVGAQVRLDLAF